MATQINRRVAYGLSEPVLDVSQGPIIAQRDPRTSDKAQIGTQWVNTASNTSFFITSIEDNIATWIPITNVGTSPTFVADTGSAAPAGGILRVTGSGDTSTSGSGNTLTINTPTTNFVTSAGTAIPFGGQLSILGGTGIATTGSGSTVTVSATGTFGSPVTVPNGGTGDASFTPYAVITGGTTSTGALQNVVGVGTLGQVLTSQGAATLPHWAAPAAGTVTSVSGGNNIAITGTGPAPIVNVSGTTNHAVQIGNATNSLTSVAVGATNQVLLGNTGADPSWGAVPNTALASSSVTLTNGQNITITGSPLSLGGTATVALSGVVPIANGGTNASTMATTDGVVYFDGTRLVTTAVGTAAQVLTSNGAGVAPTFQAAGGGGGGITTIDGNSGSATGSTVTFTTVGGFENGTPVFTGSGSTVVLTFDDAQDNLALGSDALLARTGSTGNNTAIGIDTLAALASGSNNIAIGASAASAANGASDNVVIGVQAGSTIGTGTFNIYVGTDVATLGGDGSSNIYLNNSGTLFVTESNTLRLGGGTGTSNQQLNQAFISGIQGITVTGTPILISATDQLGIAVSSKRFKSDIQPMADASDAIYKLRPVTFTWDRSSAPGLKDASQDRQCGLIAEEVALVLPQVVGFEKDGKPLNVNYGDLTSLLVNEIQKLRARIEALEKK